MRTSSFTNEEVTFLFETGRKTHQQYDFERMNEEDFELLYEKHTGARQFMSTYLTVRLSWHRGFTLAFNRYTEQITLLEDRTKSTKSVRALRNREARRYGKRSSSPRAMSIHSIFRFSPEYIM